MENNKQYSRLQLIVPTAMQSRANKLVLGTRTSSVSTQILALDDRSQQPSIIYTWNLNNTKQRDIKQKEIIDILNADYFSNFQMIIPNE